MPIEVVQSNGHVAEARFVCDNCGGLIGTRLMLETEIKAKKSKKIVCQQCKEDLSFQNKKNFAVIKHEEALPNFNLLKEELDFDADRGEVQAANSDWVIIRGGLFRDVFGTLSSDLGKDRKTYLEELGKKACENFVLSMLERGFGMSELPTILSLILNQGGWGKTEIEMDFEKKKAVITMQNCVTARNIKTKEPNCHFLRGYFEGFFEKIFSTQVECVETSCIANGGSVCSFHIQQLKK